MLIQVQAGNNVDQDEHVDQDYDAGTGTEGAAAVEPLPYVTVMVPLQGDSGTTLFTGTGDKAATQYGNACWFGGQVKHLGTATLEGGAERRAIAFVLGTHVHDVNLPIATVVEPAPAPPTAATATATRSASATATATMSSVCGKSYVAELSAPVPILPLTDVGRINTSYTKFTFPTGA